MRFRGFLLGALLGVLSPVLLAQNPAANISVDVNTARHPISPLIYGVAFGAPAEVGDLNATLCRSGGNATSRYNWQLNATNRGNDWYYESLGDEGSSNGSAAAGALGDTFITDSRNAGAEPMLTIPMVGWVAKLGPSRGRLASFSIAKYGAQTGNDWQWFPDAGNGISSADNSFIANDPDDANVPADSTFQLGWMQHLTTTWGLAGSGGLRYYLLDNEPSIWFSSHRDVHPVGPNMEEIRDKILDYGTKVKANDPGAVVLAPEEWGWSGYILSGYDQQWGAKNGWNNLPDRTAHGGMDYLPWLLDQLHQNEQATGKRILDYFTVHFYPQGGEFSDDVSNAMQAKRNRSTRSLWDPDYTDESWINDKVNLVPRVKQWVSTYYPGTLVGVTEYNWGAESHISGATAQADILGILGREAVDVAVRWTCPKVGTPVYNAFKMYRNYDGTKSAFGDTSVGVTGPDPDNVATFAATRSSDGALTVMVISKYLTGSTPMTLSFTGPAASGTAQVWQLTSANAITHPAAVAVASNSLTTSLPAQSVTLFVIPRQIFDPNGDGSVNAADVFYLVNVLFSNAVPTGYADADGNGVVDARDVFYLINYLFAGGPAPIG